MWPFKRKSLLDSAMIDWMFDQAQWLLASHAHAAEFARAQLLPLSEKVFPMAGLEGHALAEHLFMLTKTYAGVATLPVTLIPLGDSGRFKAQGGGLFVQPKSGAAGTYRHVSGQIEISYDATLVAVAADLVAVLAHELAHAILDFGAADPPPGDPAFDEIRTDFTAIFLGFGLYTVQFRSDTRVQSPETAHEWRELFANYMSFREACFATALFSAVRGVDKGLILRHAPAAAVGNFKRAFADLDEHRAAVDALKALAAQAGALQSNSLRSAARQ